MMLETSYRSHTVSSIDWVLKVSRLHCGWVELLEIMVGFFFIYEMLWQITGL